MPQMAPISWLLLFIIFSMSFMLFNMMNYYSFMMKIPTSSKQIKMNQFKMNWKW